MSSCQFFCCRDHETPSGRGGSHLQSPSRAATSYFLRCPRAASSAAANCLRRYKLYFSDTENIFEIPTCGSSLNLAPLLTFPAVSVRGLGQRVAAVLRPWRGGCSFRSPGPGARRLCGRGGRGSGRGEAGGQQGADQRGLAWQRYPHVVMSLGRDTGHLQQ